MENAIIGVVGVLLGVTITGAINIATKWLEVRSSRKSENRKMRIEKLEELHGLLWKMADARTKYARLLASAKVAR